MIADGMNDNGIVVEGKGRGAERYLYNLPLGKELGPGFRPLKFDVQLEEPTLKGLLWGHFLLMEILGPCLYLTLASQNWSNSRRFHTMEPINRALLFLPSHTHT